MFYFKNKIINKAYLKFGEERTAAEGAVKGMFEI